MASPDRQMLTLRLLPRQYKEVRAVAKKHGLSMQSFVETLVLKAIAEENERREIKIDDNEPTFGRPNIDAPTSLLAEALRQERIKAHEPVQQREQQSQVVVNVGNNGGGGGDLERFATYIAGAGNDLERDTRMRAAITILYSSANTDEERKLLAARLDEAVASKLKKSSLDGNDEGGGIVRTARVAFDKLSDLWKGV